MNETLKELDKAEEEATKKAGPDFETLIFSDIGGESAAPRDRPANSCPK
jgi:hypothetical protein